MNLFNIDLQKHLVGILLLVSLVLSACQSNTEFDSNDFKDFLTRTNANGQFNGNALILKDGEIAFQGSFGIGNTDPIDSLTVNSIFRLGSVSKQFTAMGIIKLNESGHLTYDQDITAFIPELPYRGITIRHLLNHVSGLPDYMEMMDENWMTELETNDPEKFVSGNIDLIEMFAKVEPDIHFKPGEKWEYSNTGYVLLASIVSRASGIPFAQFLKEQIFEPAQMTNTSVYKFVIGSDPEMPMRVYGYRTELNGIDLVSTDVHYLNPVAGDGGVYSTLADLLKWDRILYTEELISQNMLEEAFTPAILNNGDTTNYGFGWFIGKSPSGKQVVEHSGGWVGFVTYIYREIEENNCIIVLTNNSSRYSGGIIKPLKNILHDQPYEMPKISISEAIGVVVSNDGIDAGVEQYKKLKSDNPEKYDFAENQLNSIGYQLIQLDRIDDAIEIFRLNNEEFPNSANTYDRLGDALLASGDTTESLLIFKEAYAMDSTLTLTKEKINMIERTMPNKK
jgi:CubicO group peptidase (beta-lactamase class C family)